MTLEGNISDWTIVVFIGNNSRDLIFYTKLGPSRFPRSVQSPHFT